jgi:glycosyltransferase involved in cell wall biosynthesis
MKKNLLLFTSTFPRWSNDEEIPQFIFELGKELTKYFNVHVLAPHTPGALELEEMDSMKVIRYPYFFPRSSQCLAYGTGILSNVRKHKLAVFQVPFFFINQTCALKAAVKRYKIDIVNSHWMVPQGLTAAFIKPRYRFQHIHTIHAAGLFALRRWPFGKQLARLINKQSDAIFSVSSYNKEMLEELIKRRVQADILPMGIHTNYYLNHSEPSNVRNELGLPIGKVILYIGKLSEKKGVSFLLRAFHTVLEEQPDSTLVIVGTGDLEESLKIEAKTLGISGKVIFAGWKGKESVKKYLHASDVVTIPSIIDSRGETEGLPVVLLEALASGKPVVATRVGGATDIIVNEENGFLAKPENVQDLALKIGHILEMDTETLSKNAIASVQKYDWANIGKTYRDKILSLEK